MKRFMTYARNRKGVTLVLMAIMLAVLIMFASLAIDIAYMYYAKNQLQVAADAAALAGVANLDEANTNSVVQEPARQQAWKIACRNSAVGSPVFLVTNVGGGGGNICDSPPSSANLNSGNSATGDIVVGNWNYQTRQFSSVALPVNAVKVTARRTGETPGMDKVGLFLGKIFALIGADWSVMDVSASAIAAMPPRASTFISLCEMACGSCIWPTICELNPPRVLNTGPVNDPTSPENANKFAWTSLFDQPTGPGYSLNDLICNENPYTEVCNNNIWTTMGAATSTWRHYESLMYDPSADASNKDIINGNVVGWRVIVPVTQICPPGEQGWSNDPKTVTHYAYLYITAVCSTPGQGQRCYNGSAPQNVCAGNNHTISIKEISCISCSDPSLMLGLKPSLVS